MSAKDWTVAIRETYEDGYRWEAEHTFTAARPDVAARAAIAWNRRGGDLRKHGPLVRFTVEAWEA